MSTGSSRALARVVAVASVMGGLVASGGYLSLTLLAPLEPIEPARAAAAALVSEAPDIAYPAYGASAVMAIGHPDVELASGTRDPLPIASITKVVTALVVLEAHPLAVGEAGPTLVFGADDVERYQYQLRNNGSNVAVWPGLRLSLRETLDAVLVRSANNYAESLAVWAFGSIEAFASRAHDWLDRHGLHETRIVEPSGLDPANASTTRDLLALGRIALETPVVADIVAQPSVELSRIGELENSNRLLGVSGINGIKTGRLDTHNLLFSARLDVDGGVVPVVGAVLGAESREALFEAVLELAEGVREGFARRALVTAGEEFGHYATPWGARVAAVAARDVELLSWLGTPVAQEVTLLPQRVGASSGVVGSVELRVGHRILTVPLVLEGALEDPGPWWRLANPALLIDWS